MVINNILEHIFSAPSNVSVLRVLNKRTAGLSGRETARLTKLSLRTVQIALNNLEAVGVIKRVQGRREHSFLLNRDNFISNTIIKSVFNKEKEFKQKIFSTIAQQLEEYAVSLIVFGSVARKEDTVTSDLDICVVYRHNKKIIQNKISVLRDMLYIYYSVSLAPFYITRNEFVRKAKTGSSPVNDIIKEGTVISGQSIKELMHD